MCSQYFSSREGRCHGQTVKSALVGCQGFWANSKALIGVTRGCLIIVGWSQMLLLLRKSETGSVVSDSLWPHGLKPGRPLCPWNPPGKNPGVGCHFLLHTETEPGSGVCALICCIFHVRGVLDWVEVSLWRSNVKCLTPSVMMSGVGHLRSDWIVRVGPQEIACPSRFFPHLPLLLWVWASGRWLASEPGAGFLPDTKSASILVLDFLASKTVKIGLYS